MKGAAAATLLLLNLVLALRVVRADAPRLRGALDVSSIGIGEALRLAQHPRGVDPAARMPIGTLTEAAAFSRLSPAALSAWALLLYAATTLLVYALARELGGDWAALAAAAAWQSIFLGLPLGAGSFKQFWLTGLGLLAAVALVRHARRPRNVTAAAVGLGLGLAGLTRSTYVLLPPILAAGEAFREGSSRRRLARGALLLIFFALPLAPWTAMNASVKRRFQPIEYGAGDLSIVSGALGAIHGTEGDHIAWMGSPESARGKSVVGWAVLTVLRQPTPYLRGVASRVAYVLGLKPWLFALAALGFFLARRDAGARALALQCAYFLALLCAMPVEASYFEPFWPLLLALAGAPLARLEPPPVAAGAAAAGAGVVLAALLALLIAADSGIRALSYAVKYSRRAPWSEAALDEALARRPPEAWVSLDDARRRLRKGDAAGAIRVLEASRSVLGDLPRHRLLLARARAKAGNPAQLLALSAPTAPGEIPYNDDLREVLPLYQALALDASGRHAEARKRMSSALEGRRNHQGFSHPDLEPLSAAVKPRLVQRAEQSFAGSIESLLAEDAPSDLTRALELANDVDPTFDGWRALSRSYAGVDRKREARGALARAEELAREPEQFYALHISWAEIGDGTRSRRLLETLTRRFPEIALYWSDLGVELYRSGDEKGSERALRRALTAEPGMPAATLSLATLLGGRGAHDESRRLCASANLSRLEDEDLRAHLQACREGRPD